LGKKGGGSSSGAKAQAAASEQSAREATYADRADQYNPFGSITYGQEVGVDPGTGKDVTKWNQTQNLSPELQRIYDAQLGRIGGMGELSQGMMDRVAGDLGQKANFDQFGQPIEMQYDPTEIRSAAEDAAYQRQTNRLDPQFDQRSEKLEIKLRNQGLRPGDAAYDAQIGSFGNERTDAYEQARLSSSGVGMGEANQLWNQQLQGNQMANQLRSQGIQEYTDKRGYSLGEMQALDPTKNIADMTEAFGAG
jgi:hypothetical protein